MVKVEVKRTPELKKDLVVIKSDVQETLSLEEYKELYQKKMSELYQWKEAISQGKGQLKQFEEKVKDVVITPELEQFKKNLVVADKLKKIDELKESIRNLEIDEVRRAKEVESLTPVMTKLINQSKK